MIIFFSAVVSQAGTASVQSSGVEVFVAGKKFRSLDAYERKKEKDAEDARKERLSQLKEKGSEVSGVATVAAGILAEEPFMGKTIVIRSDGSSITSQTSIDEGKTIEIRPAGRVAGVQPSFQQLGDDFDQGKSSNGVVPTSVNSAQQLEEELRKKLRERGRPVLLISDKKKVRLMELEPLQEKAP